MKKGCKRFFCEEKSLPCNSNYCTGVKLWQVYRAVNIVAAKVPPRNPRTANLQILNSVFFGFRLGKGSDIQSESGISD